MYYCNWRNIIFPAAILLSQLTLNLRRTLFAIIAMLLLGMKIRHLIVLCSYRSFLLLNCDDKTVCKRALADFFDSSRDP